MQPAGAPGQEDASGAAVGAGNRDGGGDGKAGRRAATALAIPAGWPSAGEVEFREVRMRYRPGLPLVLHGVSFKAAAQEKVCACVCAWGLAVAGGCSTWRGRSYGSAVSRGLRLKGWVVGRETPLGVPHVQEAAVKSVQYTQPRLDAGALHVCILRMWFALTSEG